MQFKFGSGEATTYLILELYANGNIVLADANLVVIALLRSHQFETDVFLRVNEVYPVAFTTNSVASQVEKELSANTFPCVNLSKDLHEMSLSELREWMAAKLSESELSAEAFNLDAKSAPTKKNTRKTKQPTLKQLLLRKDCSLSICGPDIIEHCLATAGLAANTKAMHLLDCGDDGSLAALRDALPAALALLQKLELPDQEGFIVASLSSSSSSTSCEDEGKEELEYVDFSPLLLRQHEAILAAQPRRVQRFPSFASAVDEYFGRLEEQRLRKAARSAKAAAQRKVDKVRAEQQAAVLQLQLQQRRLQRQAQLLELHAPDVDRVLLVLNSALGAGMNWDDVEEMVALEKSNGESHCLLRYCEEESTYSTSIVLCSRRQSHRGSRSFPPIGSQSRGAVPRRRGRVRVRRRPRHGLGGGGPGLDRLCERAEDVPAVQGCAGQGAEDPRGGGQGAQSGRGTGAAGVDEARPEDVSHPAEEGTRLRV